MNAELEDWKNGWFGLRLSLAPSEIDRLIELLQSIRTDPEQHFHVSSQYRAAGGLGDIEFSVNDLGASDNLFLSGLAIEPGSEIPANIRLNK
jgi:hypothetical protein